MPIDQHKVSRALRKYGGVLPASDGKYPGVVEFRNHIKRSKQTGPEWDIVTGIAREFVANNQFNAIALCDEGQEVTALFSGLVDFLTFFNTASLARPSAWQSISFPDCTEETFKSGKLLTPENISLPRMLFTMEARMAGLYFALSHETGHVARGHLEYLRRAAGATTLIEFGASRRSALSPQTFQALEIDADAYAAEAMAWTLLNVPYSRSDILSKEARLSARLFGLTVLFGKMSQIDAEAISSPAERTHPDAASRFFLAATRLRHELEQAQYIDAQGFDQIVVRCMEEARDSWRDLAGIEWGLSTELSISVPELLAEIAEVEPELLALEETRAQRCRNDQQE